MFDKISVPFAEVWMHDKDSKAHLEFHTAIANAGTGTCRRGAYEHGCEFAPVGR